MKESGLYRIVGKKGKFKREYKLEDGRWVVANSIPIFFSMEYAYKLQKEIGLVMVKVGKEWLVVGVY